MIKRSRLAGLCKAAEGVNLEDVYETLNQKARDALGDADNVPTADDQVLFQKGQSRSHSGHGLCEHVRKT